MSFPQNSQGSTAFDSDRRFGVAGRERCFYDMTRGDQSCGTCTVSFVNVASTFDGSKRKS